MKVLLDENISQTLTIGFNKHEIKTIEEMKWSGKKNRELLRLIIHNGFDIFITMDSNIKYQHKTINLPVTIFVLIAENNRDETVQPLINIVRKKLNSKINRGIFEIIL